MPSIQRPAQWPGIRDPCKNVEIKLLYRKSIVVNFLFNNNTWFRLKAHLFFSEIVLIKYSETMTEEEDLADKNFFALANSRLSLSNNLFY